MIQLVRRPNLNMGLNPRTAHLEQVRMFIRCLKANHYLGRPYCSFPAGAEGFSSS